MSSAQIGKYKKYNMWFQQETDEIQSFFFFSSASTVLEKGCLLPCKIVWLLLD